MTWPNMYSSRLNSRANDGDDTREASRKNVKRELVLNLTGIDWEADRVGFAEVERGCPSKERSKVAVDTGFQRHGLVFHGVLCTSFEPTLFSGPVCFEVQLTLPFSKMSLFRGKRPFLVHKCKDGRVLPGVVETIKPCTTAHPQKPPNYRSQQQRRCRKAPRDPTSA